MYVWSRWRICIGKTGKAASALRFATAIETPKRMCYNVYNSARGVPEGAGKPIASESHIKRRKSP